MAKVFGGGSSCNSGGPQRIIPTSSEVASPGGTSTFSSQPNVYSKPQSVTEGINFRDYYTKSDVNKLLKIKADINSVYSKVEVDSLLQTLEGEFGTLIGSLVSDTELSSELDSLSSEILSSVQDLYYQKTSLYTKSEIDALLENVVTDADDFISKAPVSLFQNTIDPGSSSAIPLTLVASKSSQVDTVQQWIDHENNSIGRIKKSGRIEFYGKVILGQNTQSWESALDVSKRRVSNVADPIHPLDAVNKVSMQDYITEVIDAIVQEDDKNYFIDALEY